MRDCREHALDAPFGRTAKAPRSSGRRSDVENHVGGPTMRKLRQLADTSVDLLGDPSPELLEALQFTSDGIYRLLDGLG